MTSPEHILPHLYSGSCSVIFDASKYFHMFPTCKDKHEYLGLVHPGTENMHFYTTFPIGTCNSPGVSGCFGVAFIRLVIERFLVFQGISTDNSLFTYLSKRLYNPKLGEGRILVDKEGAPLVLTWMHVDDILIHGHTREKLTTVLDAILSTTVIMGLICQPCQKILHPR